MNKRTKLFAILTLTVVLIAASCSNLLERLGEEDTPVAPSEPVNVTLTFDLNGGNIVGKTENVTLTGEVGTAIDRTKIPDPKRVGYNLVAWNPAIPENYPVTATTYKAQWAKEGDYVITYNLDGGTNAETNPASYNVETDTIILAAPSRTGYEFAGWYGNADFAGNALTQIPQGSTGGVTLYAKWNPLLTGIAITTPPAKTLYMVGGSLDTAGMVVTATYGDGSTKEVTGWITSGFDSSIATENLPVTVNYMEGDITKTTAFDVEVIPEPFTNSVTKLVKGTNGTAGVTATYVYFGDWPQTIMEEGVSITAETKTQGAHTYYLGSDGNWYAKVEENGSDTRYKYSDGTYVAKKNTDSPNYLYFKVEPIKWRVLTEDYNGTGQALLLAEDILTANVPYYLSDSYRTSGGTTVYANNYKYSTIRAYLNGSYEADDTQATTYVNAGFLQTAFTADAQALIATTTVDNSAASTTNAGNNITQATRFACESTEDKIFLLSMKEATTSDYGFPEYDKYGVGNTRIRMTTDYAKANYAYQLTAKGHGGVWWLRTPCYTNVSNFAHCVYSNGTANGVSSVSSTNGGVVPALSISLE